MTTEVTCGHKEIDSDTGICKSCGKKAAIKLPFTPEEFRAGIATRSPMRKQFEEWLAGPSPWNGATRAAMVSEDQGGHYITALTQAAWSAWQGALSRSAPWPWTPEYKQLREALIELGSGWFKSHPDANSVCHQLEMLLDYIDGDLLKEKADHDAELRRIATALGLAWPTTIEEIVESAQGWSGSFRRPAGILANIPIAGTFQNPPLSEAEAKRAQELQAAKLSAAVAGERELCAQVADGCYQKRGWDALDIARAIRDRST